MRQATVLLYLEIVQFPRKALETACFLAWGVLGFGFAIAPAMAASGGDDLTARGADLVTGFGCADCHTPMKMGPKGPEPDLSRQLSGHPENLKLSPPPKADAFWTWFGAATNTALAGPLGISYMVNLTPDKEIGLGNWKEAEFVQVIKRLSKNCALKIKALLVWEPACGRLGGSSPASRLPQSTSESLDSLLVSNAAIM